MMDPALRERFERLLFSFFRSDSSLVRQGQLPELERIALLRSEEAWLSASLHKSPTSSHEQQQRRAAIDAECLQLTCALEDKYGDGHFAERRACLTDLLNDYETKAVDLEAVCAALWAARQERRRESNPGRDADARRALEAHRALLQKLRHDLLALEKSYAELLNTGNREFVIVEELDRIEKQFAIMQALKGLRDLLSVDPLLGPTIPGPYRRPAGGRPQQQWLKNVRSQLKQARVPVDPEETLLRCIGLLPYRPLPPNDNAPESGQKTFRKKVSPSP